MADTTADTHLKGVAHPQEVELVHHKGQIDNFAYLDEDPHRVALEDNPDRPAPIKASTILAIFFLGLSLLAPVAGGFLLASSVLDTIGDSLDGTANVGWIASGWAVASSVSFSLAGGLSDIFGRKHVILTGDLLTAIGGIIAATAHKTTTVVAGSTFVGFGAGLVFVTYAGIPEILPNKYRGIGLAWTEFCINVPFGIVGALVAYSLAAHASWRWIYWITTIMAMVCFVGTAFTYFPPSRPRNDYNKTRLQELMELDWIGMILYTVGLTVFLIGLSWSGEAGHAWKSASVIVPIILGFLVFVGCFAYDWTLAKNPFFPYSLFSMFREFTVTLIVLFVAGMIFFANAALLPQATLYMFDSNPIKLGIIQLPNGFGQFIGGAVLPSLIHKIKHLKLQCVTAIVIQTIFTAAYAGVVPNNKAAWMALQFFGQLCFAWVTLCCYVIVGLNVKQREFGLATGIVGTFRNAGGSVGQAVFNTILRGVLASQLAPRITAAALANGFSKAHLAQLIPAVRLAILGVPDAFAKVPGATPAVQAATMQAFRDAYGYAFQRVFLSTIPFGVIAIIAAFFITDVSKYLTNHTAIHMEKNVLGHKEPHKSVEE